MQKQLKLSELVLDFNLYPRTKVNEYNVAVMADALQAGGTLPPIIADEKSHRVTDGFHRWRAHKRIGGDDGVVTVILKKYRNDADMFADAIRLNATHGQTLSKFDRLRCIQKSEEIGLSIDVAIKALGMTKEAVGELKHNRVGKLHPVNADESDQDVPLKRTIKHMSGQDMTASQVEANSKLGGMDQRFYVNQVIILLREDLIDYEDDALMRALDELEKLLTARPKAKRVKVA